MSDINVVMLEKADANWEEFVTRGMEARENKDSSQWILGDLAVEIKTTYGEDTVGKYSYAIGVEKKTLMNYRTVSEKFNLDLRDKYPRLSFSHFAALTAVAKPEAWLEKADDENWSVEHLRNEVGSAYPSMEGPDLNDKPPAAFRCPECNNWRLKDMSAFDICRGHYKLGKGGLKYQ